jgi:hypothetical protein
VIRELEALSSFICQEVGLTTRGAPSDPGAVWWLQECGIGRVELQDVLPSPPVVSFSADSEKALLLAEWSPLGDSLGSSDLPFSG